ncbi:hypothetical protein BC829DRAFT_434076 [Chytridium lagenaria]|nr:hypothetical protein BC829DRAFT_434076 [Chytridium lagenaria]
MDFSSSPIAIIGSTGRIGALLVQDLLAGDIDSTHISILAPNSTSPPSPIPFENSHTFSTPNLRLLARTPSKIPPKVSSNPNVTIVKGEATNFAQVSDLIKDAGSVIITVGAADTAPTTIVSDTLITVLSVIASLKSFGASHPRHIFMVSSLGVNPNGEHGVPFFYKALLKPLILGNVCLDLEAAEAILHGVLHYGRIPPTEKLNGLTFKGLTPAPDFSLMSDGSISYTILQPPQLIDDAPEGRSCVLIAVGEEIAHLDGQNGMPFKDCAEGIADIVRGTLYNGNAETKAFVFKNKKVALVETKRLPGNGLTKQVWGVDLGCGWKEGQGYVTWVDGCAGGSGWSCCCFRGASFDMRFKQ